MTAKETIYKIINDDENLKTIRLNTKTNKIELNGENILSIDYDDILEVCKTDSPDTKFTKQIVKEIVFKYAREHKYEPPKVVHNENVSEWYAKIELDDKGIPKKTLQNVVKFLENYPLYKGKFSFNEFTSYETFDDELIRDYHIPQFRLRCEEELGFESKDKVEAAIQYLTHENSYNPFKDKINELIWDGKERAETFFIDFIGVHDTTLNRSMTKKWLYAMIKRLYEPGCPFDSMLIIYDATQGTGKSKIIERLVYSLGINYGYNTSITCDNKDKDNVDKLNKTWVVGIDEMNDFLKKNPEQTKQFIAQTSDQARLSYAKRSENYQRHCVFYGNSNLEYFLKDYTSNYERRYWIMNASGQRHDSQWWKENLTDDYCRQVIAEMKYFYDTNPDFIYDSLTIEEENELKEIQYAHKTLNNDELLQYQILSMLNKNYSKLEFDNYEDFYKEAAEPSSITVIDKNSAEFFGELIDKVPGTISKIPVKWVKMYVEQNLKRNVSTQYITALISTKWRYKVTKYNNKSTNCYVRRFGPTRL